MTPRVPIKWAPFKRVVLPLVCLPHRASALSTDVRPRQTVRGPVPHAESLRVGARYSRDRGGPAYLDEAAQIFAAESPFGRGGVGASTHARAGVGGPRARICHGER